MKIHANPMASFNRDVPRTVPPARQERTESAPTAAGENKAAPPGLERALARMQAIEAGERTAGQTNAMNQLARNLAKYAETQAIATPTPVPDPAPVAAPETAMDGPVAPSPAAETPEASNEVAAPVGDGVQVDALLDSIQDDTSNPA